MKKGLLYVLFFILMAGNFLVAQDFVRDELNSNFMTTVSEEFATTEGSKYRIYLFTAAPGASLAEIYFWWGHTAIIVEDTELGTKRVYDFGVFSIPEDELLLTFLQGRIDYLVVDSPIYFDAQLYSSFIKSDRWVFLQEFNFEPAAAYRVAKYLENNSARGNNAYSYHFFYQNCCTKIRDLIDYAIDGQLSTALDTPSTETLRSLARSYLQESFAADWALQYFLGPAVDKTVTLWDHLFLPIELMKAVQSFTYVDSNGDQKALVKANHQEVPPAIAQKWQEEGIPQSKAILMGDPMRVATGHSWTWLLGLLAGTGVGSVGALFFLLGSRHKGFRITAGVWTSVISLLLFVLSAALVIMQFFSTMDVTYGNWNVWLINPITMLVAFVLSLLYAADVGKSDIAYSIYWIVMSVALLGFIGASLMGFCKQENLMVLLAFVPYFILMAISGFFKNRWTSNTKK